MTSETRDTSTQQVLSAITFNGVLFGAFVCAFLLLRLKLKRIYQPKSSFNLINDEKKPEPLPKGLWQWFLPLLKKPDTFIIQQAGLDGYFFTRYLLIISIFSGVSLLWMFPLLLPINVINGVTRSGLDQLSYSNVKSHFRYYAHAFSGWIFFWGFLFVIYRELIYYTSLRQIVLSSPRYAKKLSSRTVLFQTVPEQYLSESEFFKLFPGVKRVWIARGARKLANKVSERDNLAMKLESAETNYLRTAVKNVLKLKKKEDIVVSDNISDYVSDKKRPTHRLKFLIGKKVDTINYIKEKLPEINEEVERLQSDHFNAVPFNSVFVEFESQYYAQIAFKSVIHHAPLQMSPAYIGIEPNDIIWINLRMFWWERSIRKYAAIAAIFALLILWTFPVAFVGMISNITYLTNKIHGLRFIYNLPSKLLGLLTSLFPTVALAILMMLLPIFIRKMAIISGAPSVQHVEYFTQQSYFAFQVIQVFLVTTLASSATSTVTEIVADPTSAMSILAENLPKSSNFYVSYVLLQGLTVSSGALLQIVPLILFYLLGFILDGTARKKWARFTNLSTMEWGTTFPVYTNLATIVFSYAIISPIILLFSAVGFFLLYVAYLYNLLYVYQESPDSRGIHYPRALFQTMVGLYIGQICLLGLFIVGKGWGPIVLQIICLFVTIFIHLNLNSAFDHLITVIPVDVMKSLDGKSDTPSYTSYMPKINDTCNEISFLSDKVCEASTLQQTGINPSSIHTIDTFEHGNISSMNKDNTTVTVPLLADGDLSEIPSAPLWKRFFLPHIYCSYKVLKPMLPEIYLFADVNEQLDDFKNAHAYDYPAVSSKCPYLWIPEDPYGFSKVEIADLKGIVSISDQGALFNQKGKIEWKTEPPSYNKLNHSNPFEAKES